MAPATVDTIARAIRLRGLTLVLLEAKEETAVDSAQESDIKAAGVWTSYTPQRELQPNQVLATLTEVIVAHAGIELIFDAAVNGYFRITIPEGVIQVLVKSGAPTDADGASISESVAEYIVMLIEEQCEGYSFSDVTDKVIEL